MPYSSSFVHHFASILQRFQSQCLLTQQGNYIWSNPLFLNFFILIASFLSPDTHQPQNSGPPSTYQLGLTIEEHYRMPSRPQRSTKNSRINTLGSLYAGNGQPNPSTPLAPGHDQGLFNPHFSVESVRQGRVLMSPIQPARRINREHQQHNIQQ